MQKFELELLNLYSEELFISYEFPQNVRLSQYVYSTWARWGVAISILQAGDDGISSTRISGVNQISQRGCNLILSDMIGEGWVVHRKSEKADKPCRAKYHTLLANDELKDFWKAYTKFWTERIRLQKDLLKHIFS
jgi:hypothetical protein